MQSQLNNVWWTRNKENIYFLFIVLRFLFIFSFGYVHPDEHFQSSEVVAKEVFGYSTYIPWEFEQEYPCRSIVPPAVISGIPFVLLKVLHELLPTIDIINSYTLLYLPRLFLFGLSFLLGRSGHTPHIG
jgi:phosphatidylinositol glycan class Z